MNSQDVILGMLMNRSLSGYEIKQLYEDIFSYFYSSSYGTIYPMLHRMEKEDLITKKIVPQDGKPNKNVFTITEEGKARFNTYLLSPMEADSIKSDFLMRLYFGQFVSNEMVINWLKQAQAYTQTQLEELTQKYATYKHGMMPGHMICIEIGIKEYSAKLESIQEGIERMEQLEAKGEI